jgi:hypothetical protein
VISAIGIFLRRLDMMTRFHGVAWLTAAVALAAFGCGGGDDGAGADAGGSDGGDTETNDSDSSGADAGTPDAGTPDAGDADPAIAFSNVAAYDGVAGDLLVQIDATDDVGVALVELLVDGAIAGSTSAPPFELSWDTTASADGIVSLVARATDTAGNTAEATIPVVVINAGTEVAFTDGATGEISVPESYDGTTEIDKKRHWTTDADGATRVIGIAFFTPAEGQAPWAVDLMMGPGYCPEDGTVLKSMSVDEVTAEPVVLDSTAEGYTADTQIFFHLGPANPYEHLGESLPFQLKAFAF